MALDVEKLWGRKKKCSRSNEATKRAQRVINNQFEGIKNVPHYRALNGLVNIGNGGINGTDSINLMTSLHIIIYSCFNKFAEICSAAKMKL